MLALTGCGSGKVSFVVRFPAETLREGDIQRLTQTIEEAFIGYTQEDGSSAGCDLLLETIPAPVDNSGKIYLSYGSRPKGEKEPPREYIVSAFCYRSGSPGLEAFMEKWIAAVQSKLPGRRYTVDSKSAFKSSLEFVQSEFP